MLGRTAVRAPARRLLGATSAWPGTARALQLHCRGLSTVGTATNPYASCIRTLDTLGGPKKFFSLAELGEDANAKVRRHPASIWVAAPHCLPRRGRCRTVYSVLYASVSCSRAPTMLTMLTRC